MWKKRRHKNEEKKDGRENRIKGVCVVSYVSLSLPSLIFRMLRQLGLKREN
jgi:hypothetical protein